MIIYRRVGSISFLPALAAAGALIIVAGIAATTIVIVGIAAGAARLLRVAGLGPLERPLPFARHDTIDGVVVRRSARIDTLQL